MDWNFFKKELYRLNRVEQCCNKGSEQETIVTWNGNIGCKYDPPERLLEVFNRSAKPRMIYRKYEIAPAKDKYSFPTYEERYIGYEAPPDAKNKQSKEIFFDETSDKDSARS